jgi:hypothetical protein
MKVAMLIVKVTKAMDPSGEFGEEEYEVVAGRIRLFVQSGRLDGAGDLNEWRFSEVRLHSEDSLQ